MSIKVAKKDEKLQQKMKEILQQRLAKLMASQRTQDDTAKKIGISRQNLAKYASGQSLPNSFTLYKIAKYFNVSCDYLIGKEDGTTHEVSDVVKKIGLSEEAVNKLYKCASNTNLSNALFGISRLIEYNSLDFFDVLAKYIAVPEINRGDFTDDTFYYLYIKYHLLKVESTNIELDKIQKGFEAIKFDDIIYHQVIREFDKLIDSIKKDVETKKRFISQVENTLKYEHDESVFFDNNPEEIDMGRISF